MVLRIVQEQHVDAVDAEAKLRDLDGAAPEPARHHHADLVIGHNAAKPASLPPSIGMVAPVMKDAWSEQSQAAVAATSSGWPRRCSGRLPPRRQRTASSARWRPRARIGPGAIALTRRPSAPWSSAE